MICMIITISKICKLKLLTTDAVTNPKLFLYSIPDIISQKQIPLYTIKAFNHKYITFVKQCHSDFSEGIPLSAAKRLYECIHTSHYIEAKRVKSTKLMMKWCYMA